MLQGDAWPEAEGHTEEEDEERAASDLFNRQALVELLRSTSEDSVELYGVWAGDYAEAPRKREVISAAELLDGHFRFKERCFYTVEALSSDVEHTPGARHRYGPKIL